MNIYSLFICFLILIILIFYYFEIHPYLVSKINRKYFMLSKTVSNKIFKKKVLKYGLTLAKYETPKMSLTDNTYFPIVFVRSISLKINNSNRLKNSFPRAFLLNGIFDYALSINDKKSLNNVENKVLKFSTDILKDSNEFNFTDQVSMGMVALKLYKYSNNVIYKNLCDKVIAYLLNSNDVKYNIVLYRKNKDFHYVDVLGMVCPFLLMCAEEFERPDLIDFSNKQLEYYIKNGLTSSHLPFHSIDLKNNMPMGSANWGRGLGWYMLALSATLKYTTSENNNRYSYFKNEMDVLVSNLKNFQHDYYWGQFLGVSKKCHIDTSVSCMVTYSMLLSGYECDLKDFYQFLKPLTKENGAIDYTSGDTEDINLYSREYGESELTQGLLLSIFKIENEYNL